MSLNGKRAPDADDLSISFQTLILDCCYGSNNWDLSANCDQDIYSPRSLTGSVQKGVSYFDSHVLLAACKRTQIAWKDGNNGSFTTALLRSLRNVASSHFQPTYDSLMNALPPMPLPPMRGKWGKWGK